MALDPRQIKQLKKDLNEINKLYSKLGKEKITIDVDAAGADDVLLLKQYLEEARIAAIDLEDGFGGIAESIKNIVREWKPGFADPAAQATKSFTKLKSLAEKLSDDVNGITKLREKELKQVKQQADQEKKRLELVTKELREKQELTAVEAAILANLEAEYKVQEDIVNQTQKRIEEEEKITELTGLTGQALNGANGILKKMGVNIASDKFGKLEDGARKYAEELANGEEELSQSEIRARVLGKTLKDGAKEFSNEIGAAIDAAIIKFSRDTIKRFGEDRSALAKTFGLGRAEANGLKESLNFVANSSGELNFSIADAVQSMQALNAQLGTAINFTQDELMTFSLLSDELGLSVEQSAQFVKAAKLRGESAKDYTDTLRGEIKLLSAIEGSAVNQQEVFASIGEMSAATRLSIQGQGKSLAKAAFESAKLGLSQSQLAKTSDSLLNFESSIAAEMEAELLTGKQLNLEDARRAALMGDQEGLAKAISREIGTSADFAKMNVLQQTSLAKAFGMSREELAETLEQQEMMNKFQGIGASSQEEALKKFNELKAQGVAEDEIARRLGDEQLAQQLASQSAQERFQKAMTKLSDAFVPIIDKLATLLDYLADGVEFLTESKVIFTGIAKIVGIIAGIRIFGRLKAGINVVKSLAGRFGDVAKAANGATGAIGGVASTAGAPAGSKVAQAGASAAGGAVGGTTSGIKGAATSAAGATGGGGGFFSKVGGFLKKLNPLNRLKDFFKTGGPKFLKGLAKKIPLFGSAIEAIFAASDISGMIAAGQTGSELNQAVGKRVLEALGSIGGTLAGGALGSLIPIPGLGTLIGSIGGEMLGRKLAGLLADNMDVTSIGKIFTPEATAASGGTAEDFIMRPGQGIQKFRKDDIVIGGTNLLGGGEGGGGEVVTLLKELITAVKQGGDVYIDGNKAGKSLALATSRMG